METLIEKLREVLQAAEQKINELTKREGDIRGKEQYLDMRQKELYAKITEYDSMTHHQMRVQELLEREKNVEKMRVALQESIDALNSDREKFNVWKSGEEKRIGVELRAIAEEWKKIRG